MSDAPLRGTDTAIARRFATPPRPSFSKMTTDASTRIAAVDIGSNSIRTIVADVSAGGEIRVVDEMKAMPRLGIGVDQTGMLGEGPMRAAIDALQRMAALAAQLKAERVEAVATSAVRDSANGGAFLERVHEVTGLRVRLLTGDEEARLSYRSAMAHFEVGTGRTVVADIGGGSLELALAAEGLLDRLVSLPFGAIRVTDQFLSQDDTKSPSRAREALRELRRAVRWAIRDELSIKEWRGARVIGSGGTFTNLAGVVNARAGVQGGGNKSRHGTVVPRAELEHTLAKLAALGPAERRAVPGLNPERADIIIGGLAVAAEVLAVFEGRELLVSGYGIREGILLETAMVAPSAPADPAVSRERSVRAFAERCHYEQPHAEQVRRLSLRLYDQLAARLGCEPGDREVLADAALLHDVGYQINYEKHHKHSYHLVRHADLQGISPAEQVAIANVARYHRGAVPKREHSNFGALDRALRQRVRRLAALLRVADGLDRGHAGAVRDVSVTQEGGRVHVEVTPVPEASLQLELWGAERKAGLLAKLLGKEVAFAEAGPDVAG